MAWWRDAVVYEIYVRAFQDSDGDGVGDLDGIRSRLPYLQALCVDAIWLTPFYPSPMRDGGYDVSDPCDVDPLFGDLDGFDRLVADAHRLGLKVIVDLVPNHTSDQHPWFQEALRNRAARRRYVFAETPNNWLSFRGGSAWTRVDEEAYLHLFAPEQPDLNWRDPEVNDAYDDVLRFWLDRGVDGFRIDVAHGLLKAEGLPDDEDVSALTQLVCDRYSHSWGQPEVCSVYRRWRAIADSFDGDRLLLGEVYAVHPADLVRYTESLDQVFNFFLLQTSFDTVLLRSAIDAALVVPNPTWTLSNHDLSRQASRLGGADRALALSAFLWALPGSVYVYQGEELGLYDTDVPRELAVDPFGRDRSRTPMLWDADGGFTTGTPFLPLGAGQSVAEQEGDAGSALEAYRALLRLRRELLSRLGREVTWRDTPPGVLAVAREGGLVAVLNTTSAAVPLPDGEVLWGDGGPVSTTWLLAP